MAAPMVESVADEKCYSCPTKDQLALPSWPQSKHYLSYADEEACVRQSSSRCQMRDGSYGALYASKLYVQFLKQVAPSCCTLCIAASRPWASTQSSTNTSSFTPHRVWLFHESVGSHWRVNATPGEPLHPALAKPQTSARYNFRNRPFLAILRPPA